jgi:hypothetical protein
VDETDVAKVAVGGRAFVRADALVAQKFFGHVVRPDDELGRKNFRTDEPAERADRKILGTPVQLDDSSSLPIGLRADADIILSGKKIWSIGRPRPMGWGISRRKRRDRTRLSARQRRSAKNARKISAVSSDRTPAVIPTR